MYFSIYGFSQLTPDLGQTVIKWTEIMAVTEVQRELKPM